MIRYLPIILFSILLVFLYCGLWLDKHRLPSSLLNQPIPHFQLTDLRNPKQIITEKDLLGRITVLNIWSSWCNACLREHQEWQRISKPYPNLIWGLNYKDERNTALQWLSFNGNPYQRSLYDPQGDLGIDLGIYGTPETYIIDRKGIIRYRYSGPIDEAIWQQQLLPRIQQWQKTSS